MFNSACLSGFEWEGEGEGQGVGGDQAVTGGVLMVEAIVMEVGGCGDGCKFCGT